LLLGPFNGVLVINACGMVTSLVVLTQVWRDVDLRRAALLVGSALPAVVAGAWMARSLPAPPLAIVVGVLILVALVAVVTSERARVLRGTPGAVIAGLGSGFLNVTVGAGGPAVAVYAVSIGWAQRRFAASAQLVFAALGAASLIAKGGHPSMSATGWSLVVAGLLIGILIGHHLAERVSAARRDRARHGGRRPHRHQGPGRALTAPRSGGIGSDRRVSGPVTLTARRHEAQRALPHTLQGMPGVAHWLTSIRSVLRGR